MKMTLVVMTQGKSEGKTIPITLSQFLIGRDPQCQLRPASASISKRHCAILVRGSKVFVRDFESTNGTFVNDQPVKGEAELHHEDRLKIGPLLFGVRIEAAAPAGKAGSVPPSRPTPPPPTRPAQEAVDEDSVASLLLAMGDEGDASSAGGSEVPDGSTVTEGIDPGEGQGPESAPDQAGKKPDPAKAKEADTSEAARAILQKYMRRPRA